MLIQRSAAHVFSVASSFYNECLKAQNATVTQLVETFLENLDSELDMKTVISKDIETYAQLLGKLQYVKRKRCEAEQRLTETFKSR